MEKQATYQALPEKGTQESTNHSVLLYSFKQWDVQWVFVEAILKNRQNGEASLGHSWQHRATSLMKWLGVGERWRPLDILGNGLHSAVLLTQLHHQDQDEDMHPISEPHTRADKSTLRGATQEIRKCSSYFDLFTQYCQGYSMAKGSFSCWNLLPKSLWFCCF